MIAFHSTKDIHSEGDHLFNYILGGSTENDRFARRN